MTERRLVSAGVATASFARARPLKSASAFRTISEVADQLDVPQHVLRFWETRFTQIRPLKRAGGRRYYRPEDVELLRRIRELLYRDGYTIKGVQKLLRDTGRDHGDIEDDAAEAADLEPIEPPAPVRVDGPPLAAPAMDDRVRAAKQALTRLIDELEAIRGEIESLRSSR